MSLRDFSLARERYISVTLDHGDAAHRNLITLSGTERAWLSDTFLTLKDAVDRTRPQVSWLRRHPTLLLNLIALGLGSLGMLLFDGVASLLLPKLNIPPLPADSPWRPYLTSLLPLLYVAQWIWRWLVGFVWGAVAVRDWLLTLWPSIEFDFGLAHLQSEKVRRARMRAVGALVVLPILTSLAVDWLKLVR
jgi:hypothetical protein